MAKMKEAYENDIDLEELEETAAQTLVGDVRDAILDSIRHGKDQKPWAQMTEDEQASLIDHVSRIAESTVRRAVKIIANKGFNTSYVEIASWKVKGKALEATVKTVATDENVINFLSAGGQLAALVFASEEEFDQQRKPCDAEPDQRALPIENEVQAA